MLEHHGSLAETFPLFEPAGVDIAMLDVCHPTLTIGLVGCPFTFVFVTVGVHHGTSAAFPARDKVAFVSITGQRDQDSVAVGPSAFKGVGSVAAAEIGAVGFVAEVGRVVEAAEEQEEVDGIGTLALSFEIGDRARYFEHGCFTGTIELAEIANYGGQEPIPFYGGTALGDDYNAITTHVTESIFECLVLVHEILPPKF